MESNLLKDAPGVIRDFLVYMQTIKGKSPKTVDEYYLDLRTFFRFLKQRRGLTGPDTDFEKIPIDDVDLKTAASVTLTDVYEYLLYITRERHNGPAARSRKVSSLRSFYRYYCDKTRRIAENPVRNLETPKKKRSLPKYLTLEESMQFLQSIEGPYAARDYCIMTLFLNCGLRLSELVGINMADFHDSALTVTGKGNKQRNVYLNEACLQAVEAYRAQRPKEGVKDREAFFLSRRMTRISPKTVQYIVKKDLRAAGLAGRGFSTHKLRHTAATLMYQRGGVDVRALQELLGHENLSTTEIYTHTSSRQVKQAVESNPLAKFHPTGRHDAEPKK